MERASEIEELRARCRRLEATLERVCGVFDGMARRGMKLYDVLTDQERHTLLAAANLTDERE